MYDAFVEPAKLSKRASENSDAADTINDVPKRSARMLPLSPMFRSSNLTASLYSPRAKSGRDVQGHKLRGRLARFRGAAAIVPEGHSTRYPSRCTLSRNRLGSDMRKGGRKCLRSAERKHALYVFRRGMATGRTRGPCGTARQVG